MAAVEYQRSIMPFFCPLSRRIIQYGVLVLARLNWWWQPSDGGHPSRVFA